MFKELCKSKKLREKNYFDTLKSTEEKNRNRIREKNRNRIRNPVLVTDLYKNATVPDSGTANWYKKFSRAKEGQSNDPHVHINSDFGKQEQKNLC
jgi:hypothetical protein